MNHYVVTSDAIVYRAVNATQAKAVSAAIEKSFYATDADLKSIPTSVLVLLHNAARPEKPVVRFADRATAEKRIDGVLDLLAKTLPAKYATTPAPAAKEPKAGKTTTRTVIEVPDAHVEKALKWRAEGKQWAVITELLGFPLNYVHKLRPLMKLKDPKSVMAIGPGSPSYGTKKNQPKVPRVPGQKRTRAAKTSTANREDF